MLQATVYLWPRRDFGVAHISIEITGKYFSWPTAYTKEEDQALYETTPIEIQLPAIPGAIDDFVAKYKSNPEKYNALMNNDAHVVQQICYLAGYYASKPPNIPAMTPHRIARQMCHLALELLEEQQKDILNQKSIDKNALVTNEVAQLKIQRTQHILQHCLKNDLAKKPAHHTMNHSKMALSDTIAECETNASLAQYRTLPELFKKLKNKNLDAFSTQAEKGEAIPLDDFLKAYNTSPKKTNVILLAKIVAILQQANTEKYAQLIQKQKQESQKRRSTSRQWTAYTHKKD